MPYSGTPQRRLRKVREAVRRHYAAHKEKVKEAVYARRNANRKAVQNYKESMPCSDCQGKYPHYCMDFDHDGRKGKKIADVSMMISYGWNLQTILEEIEKCELVCSNCHRRRTHKRRIAAAKNKARVSKPKKD